MGVINRSAIKERLWPGIKYFFGEYKGYPMQYPDTYTTEQSDKAYEEYVQEFFFGTGMVKQPGENASYDEAGQSWKGRVDMRPYALGYIIPREAVADNLYESLVPKYTKALRRSMNVTKEIRAAAFLQYTFTTSMTGDGVSVVSDVHKLPLTGNTFSNAASVPRDINEMSLESATIQISEFVDERGLIIGVRPRKVVAPSSQQFILHRLMNSQGRPGTSDNDPNAIRQMGTFPEGFAINNYLTDPRNWWILTDIDNGMTHWERDPLEVEQGEGMDAQVLKVMAYERYAFSCQDPRGIWGSPGTPQG